MAANTPVTLNRRAIARTALAIMERDGFAAFSMPRLGNELGIRTPSLYHHFRDRADLLAEVARTVVTETELPARTGSEHWTAYFVDLAVNFRRTILRHRGAAPVLLQSLPRDVLTPLYEAAAVVLRDVPELPLSAHVLVLDGMEKIALGTALIEAASPPGWRGPFPNADPTTQPQLTAAVEKNERDAEQLLVASVRAFLAGVVQIHRPAAG